MKTKNRILAVGIFTGVASSLCCITPVLSLVAGTGILTGVFDWLEPLRWPLIIVSILALGFAWYLKIKPFKNDNCNCDAKSQNPFFQSTAFLGGVTVFVVLSLTFPYYAEAFYPSNEKGVVLVQEENIQTVEYLVSGMTCAGCEGHIKTEVNKLKGIISCQVSYEKGNTIVKFDPALVNVEDLKTAIERTGYKVIKDPGQ